MSEWADRYRMLSRESSAEPGKWRTDRAPYQRGIMDACSDPLIERVVWMSSAQVGKTEGVNNLIGFYVDQDPSPILVLQPTLDMAEAWSKDRLTPMLRDTPRLKGKIVDARARNSGNTLLHKSFPGGQITIVGANSPSSLASRPIRIVLCDEVDRYPPSAGTEGDPVGLATKRTSTFWNRKIVLVSTPKIKGTSRIEKEWAESDQRRYHVPCPHCGHLQTLKWAGLVWEPDRPETVVYACEACGVEIDETEKGRMLAAGVWVAGEPGRRVAGFHLNALYSPWARWAELVDEFLKAKDNPELLQVFVNTVLGELWDPDRGEKVSAHVLYERLEPFAAEVPAGVAVLTRSVDVQGDRLETAVWGWGAGEEAWRVDWELIPGDPGLPIDHAQSPWRALDEQLGRTYRHESGVELKPPVTFVDSGGHHTSQVYAFTRARIQRGVFATKGSSEQEGVPLLAAPSRKSSAKAILYMVGSFTGKELLHARLKIREPGPGYVHLAEATDVEHLEQLTAESLVTRYTKGRPKREWIKASGVRNEQTDLYVMALAALHKLGPNTIRRLGAIAEELKARGERQRQAAPQSREQNGTPPDLAGTVRDRIGTARPPRRGGGWVNGWR